MTDPNKNGGARSHSDLYEGQLRSIIAADLRLLASLHASELESEELTELADHPFASRLGLVLDSADAQKGLTLIDDSLAVCRGENAALALEELKADFAGIYYTHRFRASPTESTWLDDDGLERQGPMFAVREWYQRYGLGAHDWRKRPDDHLALQLEFAAHILQQDMSDERSLEEVARFLDAHMLRWIDKFATQVSGHCATPFYAGVAMITACYLDELRTIVTAVTGFDRPVQETTPADEAAPPAPAQKSGPQAPSAVPG